MSLPPCSFHWAAGAEQALKKRLRETDCGWAYQMNDTVPNAPKTPILPLLALNYPSSICPRWLRLLHLLLAPCAPSSAVLPCRVSAEPSALQSWDSCRDHCVVSSAARLICVPCWQLQQAQLLQDNLMPGLTACLKNFVYCCRQFGLVFTGLESRGRIDVGYSGLI